MSGIKYYRLGDGEELPDEFCVIRDVNGEPDEYAWYEPMDAFDRKLWGIFKDNDWVVASEYRKLKAENDKLRQQLADVTESMGRVEERCAKLRELVRDVSRAAHMLCEAWEGSCSKEAEGMSLHAVCPISDTNELCVFGKLYERMRELRVEVDDG